MDSDVTITPDLPGFGYPPLDIGENRGPTATLNSWMLFLGLLALVAIGVVASGGVFIGGKFSFFITIRFRILLLHQMPYWWSGEKLDL